MDAVTVATFEHRVKFADGSQGEESPKSPLSPKSPSRSRIASAAQAVLDARAAHPNATLADLYDPLTMPPDLVKAHAHLDALVDKAYGLSPSCTDLGRVAHLFKLYAENSNDCGGKDSPPKKCRRQAAP